MLANWIPTEKGNFTVAIAWDTIRKKKFKDTINKFIWSNNLPFKETFFLLEL